jgi:hypothetical protein
MLKYPYLFIFLRLKLFLKLLILVWYPVVLDLALLLDGISTHIIVDLKGEGGNLLRLITFAEPLEGVGGGENKGAGDQEASAPLLLFFTPVVEADFADAAVGEIEQIELAHRLPSVLTGDQKHFVPIHGNTSK